MGSTTTVCYCLRVLHTVFHGTIEMSFFIHTDSAVSGMHEDLGEGMTALSASISAVHASQVRGTATVLVSCESRISWCVYTVLP